MGTLWDILLFIQPPVQGDRKESWEPHKAGRPRGHSRGWQAVGGRCNFGLSKRISWETRNSLPQKFTIGAVMDGNLWVLQTVWRTSCSQLSSGENTEKTQGKATSITHGSSSGLVLKIHTPSSNYVSVKTSLLKGKFHMQLLPLRKNSGFSYASFQIIQQSIFHNVTLILTHLIYCHLKFWTTRC